MKLFAKLAAVAFCASVFAALVATPVRAQATGGSPDHKMHGKMHTMAHSKMMGGKHHRKHHKKHKPGMMGHKMGMMNGKKMGMMNGKKKGM